ncbi:hypothetical protein DK847_20100 [Aestuariivirga litoralis]|uniref:Uncharacterized protein n=2 Tax=Aestuariivirga litoralis TaxID=2650924 RepID=A0A2W2C4M0_9HYPH|nr:hypothetical protein DK847_20100 [Aestuariivirga litoralis]
MGLGMGADMGANPAPSGEAGGIGVNPGQSEGVVPVVVAGIVAGLDGIGFAVAVASLLFTGALAGGLSMGAGAALLCTIIMSALAGWRSSLPVTVSHVQDMGVAVLSVTLGATVATLAAPPDIRIATAFTIIALSTLAAGLLMWLTGRFRAGLVVKFFPLEVLAGFMAGTGWLLLTGGLAMTAGLEPGSALLLGLTDPAVLKLALPALGFGVLLYLCMARFSHPLMLLGLLLGAVALFYLWLLANGRSVAEAAAAGYLPQIDSGASLALPFPGMLWQTDWGTVAGALPGILTAAVLCLFAALMNTSALDMAAGGEVDIDREMRLTGGSNLLVACAGGPPGYPGLAISVLAQKLGVRRRGLGLVTALVVLGGFLFSREIVAHVPLFVNAGLIIYFGLDLLHDWLVSTYRRFSLREWSVVVLIVLVVAFSGFLQAIGAGFLVATVLFAWSYAHVPVIRNTATLATLPSSIERSPEDMAFIAARGAAIKIIQLQGFLFFGTAERLMAPLREAMAQRGSGTDAVVLDLSHVTSLDSASAAALMRLVAAAGRARLDLLLCGIQPSVQQTLERAGMEHRMIRHFNSLDQALEHVERKILAERAHRDEAASQLFLRHGAAIGEEAFARLLVRFTPEDIRAGDPILRAGEWADRLYFLERGRAVVMLPRQDGGRRRLRTMEAGALLGDVAFALDLPRTADVMAEDDCRVLSITAAEIRAMERDDPVLGVALQRIISRALAEKVIAANRLTDHMRS